MHCDRTPVRARAVEFATPPAQRARRCCRQCPGPPSPRRPQARLARRSPCALSDDEESSSGRGPSPRLRHTVHTPARKGVRDPTAAREAALALNDELVAAATEQSSCSCYDSDGHYDSDGNVRYGEQGISRYEEYSSSASTYYEDRQRRRLERARREAAAAARAQMAALGAAVLLGGLLTLCVVVAARPRGRGS